MDIDHLASLREAKDFTCRPYPLGWHTDELEGEGFNATRLLQPEGISFQPTRLLRKLNVFILSIKRV